MTITSKIEGAAAKTQMINHIIFLIDSSGSMHRHLENVKKVFDSTLKSFRSIQNEQEINISVYDFNNTVTCQLFNNPLSTLSKTIEFKADGLTAMRDCIYKAITDHQRIVIPKGEDHTFLIYAITDGADNMSKVTTSSLKEMIGSCDDSWTIAALVPSISDAHSAKISGIPAGNIQVWDASSSTGFEEVGAAVATSYQSYSVARSAGTRSSSTMFQVSADNVKRGEVRQELKEISGSLFHARKDYVIRDMVEQFTGKEYVKGSTFYELSKPELVQGYKEIVIVSRKDDKKFGGNEARNLLGMPTADTKMKPGDFGDWRIFIQSTSVNRKIKSGTSIFVKQ